MELVLEQQEVDKLLREALAARNVKVPAGHTLVLRQNHKKVSFRIVFKISALQESLTDV